MKNSEVTVLAGGNNAEIPQEELDKICTDFKLAYNLGDKMQMILDAMNKYCK